MHACRPDGCVSHRPDGAPFTMAGQPSVRNHNATAAGRRLDRRGRARRSAAERGSRSGRRSTHAGRQRMAGCWCATCGKQGCRTPAEPPRRHQSALLCDAAARQRRHPPLDGRRLRDSSRRPRRSEEQRRGEFVPPGGGCRRGVATDGLRLPALAQHARSGDALDADRERHEQFYRNTLERRRIRRVPRGAAGLGQHARRLRQGEYAR